MTRRPRQQARPEEAHASAPEPPAEEAEGRVALGRVFGTEA